VLQGYKARLWDEGDEYIHADIASVVYHSALAKVTSRLASRSGWTGCGCRTLPDIFGHPIGASVTTMRACAK
jgi:hypothetical protein